MAKSIFVISAFEKTSIQAKKRKQPIKPPKPGQPMLVEHEFEREGGGHTCLS